MNYIAELNAFYDRLELNPLPSPAIALWHALMSIANKTGWQEEFTVAVSVLVLKSGLNAQAIKRARNRLEQDGYITWRSRNGNQSAVYRMESLVVQNRYKNVPQSVPQNEPQNEPQPVPQNEPQSVPINKQKENETPLSDRARRFLEFWSAYPKQVNQQMAQQSYISLLACTPTLPEDVLVQAAGNYAEACRIRQIGGRYIKNPENWLADGVWMDYTPEKYRRPELPQERGRRSDGSMGRNDKPVAKGANERLLESGYKPEYKEYPFAD